MRSSSLAADCVWPAANAIEALDALAAAAGLRMNTSGAGRAAGWLVGSKSLEQHAAHRGIEVESVAIRRTEVEDFLRGAAPALVPIADKYALLLGAASSHVELLRPDGTRKRVALRALSAAIEAEQEEQSSAELVALLSKQGVAAPRLQRVRRALAGDTSSQRPLAAYLLRAAVGSSLGVSARSLRLWPRLAGLLSAKVAEQCIWILSWVALGRGALAGTLDSAWVCAWAMLLLTVLALQSLSLFSAGRLAIDLGAELRRKLMAGALRLAPERMRGAGAGQALGRVLESEALEQLALSGGFQSLFAAVELLVGACVLALGASPLLQLSALAAWLCLTLFLGLYYLRARRAWSLERLQHTHGLVERMVGHATRLVQADPQHEQQLDDRELEAYARTSARMDRALVALTAWIPRGWLLLGVLSLAPAFVGGSRATALALSIGGTLLAYRALRQAADGLSELAGARVAWEVVQPLLEAARAQVESDEVAAPRPLSATPATNERALLTAHELSFQHAARADLVLSHCALEIHAGQKLVLAGRSGSGKSTLAAILGGLRLPASGLLLLQGLDRETLGAAGWRQVVALAPQFHENHVFGGTLLFNLLMGRAWPPSATDCAEAEEMCRRLGLGPLLARMPCGILQHVGETGWRLSQGERARLWIARALLQGSGLIIVDEGLDALDPESLECVQRVLLESTAAVLLIAHP